MPIPKLPLKLLGLLDAYHLNWWARHMGRRPVLTDWNRAHRAIFVHIPKTAGTTMLEALGAAPVVDTHAPALTYRRADPTFFASAFKFAVIRNPWDRFASSFSFMKNGTDWPMQQRWAARHIGELDFAGFVRKLRHPLFRQLVLSERFFWPQSFWVTDRSGALIVDEFYRFEQLAAVLPAIQSRLGIAGSNVIPVLRKSARPPSCALYENQEMVDLVARLYGRDIERFGYGFEATVE